MEAERFEQAGAFAGDHSRQLLIPLPQRLHHLLAPSRELGDLRVHGGPMRCAASRTLSHGLPPDSRTRRNGVMSRRENPNCCA
jgi:hypothetical protein